MSYWTRYCAIGITEYVNDVTKNIPVEIEEKIAHRLSELLGYTLKFADFDDVCAEATAAGIAYDTFMEALLKVSKEYPNYYFDYEGKGDDWDDWFVCRIHNGKYGVKFAVLPPIDTVDKLIFNENSL